MNHEESVVAATRAAGVAWAEVIACVPMVIGSEADLRASAAWLDRMSTRRKEVEGYFYRPITGLKIEIQALQEQRDRLTTPLVQAEAQLRERMLEYRRRVAMPADTPPPVAGEPSRAET